ncbi:hypothetical protein NDU88_008725 [Pleurodeles waltl]|uniref:Lamina-associated polypeptide 2 alpha C-terminal domain-containing protein n=1 Tax=Pleurodeles waltl TaxID=8319 RepID=A0AAV7NWY5_PLEWA|nr:hypothetical protein NDU88_008725 [Pleurodeles waltl]
MYGLENAEQKRPHNIKIDAPLLTLIGHSSINPEDCSPKDQLDKGIEKALKRSYEANNMSLMAGTYAAYTAQSLVKDFEKLAEDMQEEEDCSDLLVSMEQQARFLSDASCDSINSAAMASWASVLACRHMWLRDWKADTAEKSALLKISFQGNKMFGDHLERIVTKTFKDHKHALPYKGKSRTSRSYKDYKRSDDFRSSWVRRVQPRKIDRTFES